MGEFPLPEEPEKVRTFAGELKPEGPLPPKKKETLKPVTATRTQFIFSGDEQTLALYRALQASTDYVFVERKTGVDGGRALVIERGRMRLISRGPVPLSRLIGKLSLSCIVV